jgi:hypothetical protein
MKHIITFFLLAQAIAFSQSIGGNIGGGMISSDSPNIGSATGSIFVESPGIFNNAIVFRLSFLYAVDLDKLLPSTTNRYYPFLKALIFRGVTNQPAAKNWYLEEGIGFMAVNDRVFFNSNAIDYGIVLSLESGYDFRNSSPKGMRVGAGVDYGFTFTNTYAKYFSLYLQGQYYF